MAQLVTLTQDMIKEFREKDLPISMITYSREGELHSVLTVMTFDVCLLKLAEEFNDMPVLVNVQPVENTLAVRKLSGLGMPFMKH